MSDYAILVGISQYPNAGFSNLKSPLNDVNLFEKWLRCPTGGAINDDDPGNPRVIKLITPNPYPTKFDLDAAPPTQYEFERLFRKFATRFDANPGNRLYLFFSGHGFSERKRIDTHAALYTADADDKWAMNIFGTYYAQMALRKGWFKEVVLVMDCCRDSEINRKAALPPIDEAFDEGAAANGRLLAFYGAPFGGRAQERPIADEDNRVHGLLTYALYKALHEAPCDQVGRLTGQQLKNFIYASWNKLFGDDAPDLPRIQTPDGDDIIVAKRPEPEKFEQRITLPKLLTVSAEVVILGGRLEKLFTCKLQPVGKDSTIEFPNGTAESLAFDGQTLVVRLPAGVYELEFTGTTPSRRLPLIVRGDNNVEF